jgi:hypothetical protein
MLILDQCDPVCSRQRLAQPAQKGVIKHTQAIAHLKMHCVLAPNFRIKMQNAGLVEWLKR